MACLLTCMQFRAFFGIYLYIWEADADVGWHQAMQATSATSSDLLRAVRQVEEPQLSIPLWTRTPKPLRWALSKESLLHLRSLAGDEDEIAWCDQQLVCRFPEASDKGPGKGLAGKGGSKGKGKAGKPRWEPRGRPGGKGKWW